MTGDTEQRTGGMGGPVSSPLEDLMRHPFRLDLLACLVHGEQLTTMQLAGRIGKPRSAVDFHLRLLEGFDLVVKNDDGLDISYVATLDRHPRWVRDAVLDHKRTKDATISISGSDRSK